MPDRRFFVRAGWTLAIAVGGFALACSDRAPASTKLRAASSGSST